MYNQCRDISCFVFCDLTILLNKLLTKNAASAFNHLVSASDCCVRYLLVSSKCGSEICLNSTVEPVITEGVNTTTNLHTQHRLWEPQF